MADDPASGIEGEVCQDIASRQRIGIKKYGVTVDANRLSLEQWLQHAYEEGLDQVIYLKKAIKELNIKKCIGQDSAEIQPENRVEELSLTDDRSTIIRAEIARLQAELRSIIAQKRSKKAWPKDGQHIRFKRHNEWFTGVYVHKGNIRFDNGGLTFKWQNRGWEPAEEAK